MMVARLVLMAMVSLLAVGTGIAATVTGEAALAAVRDDLSAMPALAAIQPDGALADGIWHDRDNRVVWR